MVLAFAGDSTMTKFLGIKLVLIKTKVGQFLILFFDNLLKVKKYRRQKSLILNALCYLIT